MGRQRRQERRVGREQPVVLHLTTTDVSLDLLLLPQLRAFTEAGFRVVGASAPGPHVASLEAAGIEHEPIRSFTRSSNVKEDVRALIEIAQLIRRLKPDIVHTHNPKPGVIGRPVARLLGVPLVVNTQHGLFAQPEDRLRRRLPVYAAERIAAAFSDMELVQNPEDVETLTRRLHVPADRVRLLGNGIDLQRFHVSSVDPAARLARRAEWGVGIDDVLVGSVCRVTREKGISELLTAFEYVRARQPTVRLVVIGPDESSDDLGPEIARGRDAGVTFLGLRNDMPECYSALDIFVTATWREGFPRSAMEASALGLPLVATDVRGCRQVVENGATGLLVPVRDAKSLAAALARLTGDSALRSRLGDAARIKANRDFDERAVVLRTLAVYSMLASRVA